MDIKKSIAKIFGGREQSNVPILLKNKDIRGNWEIEQNFPYGFVVKNLVEKEEWHFDYASNGWVTGLNKTNPNAKTVIALNTKGFTGFAPVLMDKESIAARETLKKEVLQKVKD